MLLLVSWLIFKNLCVLVCEGVFACVPVFWKQGEGYGPL